MHRMVWIASRDLRLGYRSFFWFLPARLCIAVICRLLGSVFLWRLNNDPFGSTWGLDLTVVAKAVYSLLTTALTCSAKRSHSLETLDC